MGDMWRAFQSAKVVAAAVGGGIRMFIHLPVFEFRLSFSVYSVISLPRVIGNASRAIRYFPLPAFLAVSSDRQTFLELSEKEGQPCISQKRVVCPTSQAINRKNAKEACAGAIFLKDESRVARDCISVASP